MLSKNFGSLIFWDILKLAVIITEYSVFKMLVLPQFAERIHTEITVTSGP